MNMKHRLYSLEVLVIRITGRQMQMYPVAYGLPPTHPTVRERYNGAIRLRLILIPLPYI